MAVGLARAGANVTITAARNQHELVLRLACISTEIQNGVGARKKTDGWSNFNAARARER